MQEDIETAVARIQRLDAERARVIEEAKTDALQRAQEAIDELNALGVGHYRITDSATLKTGAPPRYRNPNDHSQTWSGKGRMATWMAALLAANKELKKEDFLNPDRA